jgi:glycosyltransferase involved in cell wall biosynthesis
MPRLPRRSRPAPLSIGAPAALLEFLRDGAVAPADGPSPAHGPLRVAIVIPPFRRGSGGHRTIADLVRGLEARGHGVSLWLDDDEGRHAGDDDVGALFREYFGPVAGDVHGDLAAFAGADVAMATGWQTVHRVLRLPGVSARAYLVQDHEPEFFGTSAERTWAQQTYGLGLHCICASPWLQGLCRDVYGASASSFDLGVDHDAYKPWSVHRRDDLVLFYARAVTPRRAVPLGLLALEELHRRRPQVELMLFGDTTPLRTPFPHRDLGVLDRERLAHAYNSATVGLVLSATNPSLVPTEMLACGLPVVDLASDAMVQTFGADGPIELVPFDPLAIATAIERLLDDLELRAQRMRDGLQLTAGRTWAHAAEQVETGLRAALREAS